MRELAFRDFYAAVLYHWVIFVSSGGMYAQALPVGDPEYRSGRYRGATAYARSKRIQVAFTPLLAQRCGGTAPRPSASTRS